MNVPLIHPTAVIHPEAKLGANVRVGPFAVIEGPAEIGDDCEIQAHAIVTGWVRMGARNRIGYSAVIGGEPQDLGFKPEMKSWVVIGDDNWIREYATLHRGTGEGSETRLGNHCFLMAGAHVGHNCQVADHVIAANNVLLGGHVHVGTGAFLGGGSVYHQFVHVGRNAIIQGNSPISKNVPPFVMIAHLNIVMGMNIIGMRRSGMTADQRKEVKDAYKLLYKSGLNPHQALAAAKERAWGPAATEFFEFVATHHKRGLCNLAPSRKASARGEAANEE